MNLQTLQRFLSTALAISTVNSAQAQSTWQGTSSSDWATASNWSTDPALPAVGDDITIADITGNNLALDTDRTIGSFIFGDTGTRPANFTSHATGAQFITLTLIPEPSTLAMLSLLGLIATTRRKGS